MLVMITLLYCLSCFCKPKHRIGKATFVFCKCSQAVRHHVCPDFISRNMYVLVSVSGLERDQTPTSDIFWSLPDFLACICAQYGNTSYKGDVRGFQLLILALMHAN